MKLKIQPVPLWRITGMSLSLAALLAAGGTASAQTAAKPAKMPKMAVCVICGVREKSGPEPVAATFDYKGKTYYFCQEGCKEEFQQDPEKWIKAAAEAGHQHPAGPAGNAGGGASAAPS